MKSTKILMVFTCDPMSFFLTLIYEMYMFNYNYGKKVTSTEKGVT